MEIWKWLVFIIFILLINSLVIFLIVTMYFFKKNEREKIYDKKNQVVVDEFLG